MIWIVRPDILNHAVIVSKGPDVLALRASLATQTWHQDPMILETVGPHRQRKVWRSYRPVALCTMSHLLGCLQANQVLVLHAWTNNTMSRMRRFREDILLLDDQFQYTKKDPEKKNITIPSTMCCVTGGKTETTLKLLMREVNAARMATDRSMMTQEIMIKGESVGDMFIIRIRSVMIMMIEVTEKVDEIKMEAAKKTETEETITKTIRIEREINSPPLLVLRQLLLVSIQL
jgi:hypothetical protein